MRVVVLANTAWYLQNFRLNLMLRLQAAGHEVIAVSPADGYKEKITRAGIEHQVLPMSGSGTNPLLEAITVLNLYKLLRAKRPHAVLSYTPKGNIYGALAAIASGTEVVCNVSGLGRAFVRPGPLSWFVKALYRLSFSRAMHVFFQNQEDMLLFLKEGLVTLDKGEHIPGSGVDVMRFRPPSPSAAAPSCAPFTFLLAARLLWDKGVGEYVAAARMVRARFPDTQFNLLGFLADDNKRGVPEAQIRAWVQEGTINFLGATDDVVPVIAQAGCVVLPSYYREGLPRILLESASMARPIVTADSPGCRDAVDDGVTGYLCRPRDAEDLAEKMVRILSLPPAERAAMGQRARARILRAFDENIIIDRYLNILERRFSTP